MTAAVAAVILRRRAIARRRRISRPRYRLLARLRVVEGDTIVLGPGKADLLEALAESGSIRDAAKQLGMSYMRAWSLIRLMNERFREPLVRAVRGGARRGGAILTPTGRAVLRLYQQMNSASLRAAGPAMRELRHYLR